MGTVFSLRSGAAGRVGSGTARYRFKPPGSPLRRAHPSRLPVARNSGRRGGPGQIHFSDYWATYMVGSAALAVILFDGGLRMRASTMRGAVVPAVILSTVGVMLTAGLVALAALPLLGLPPLESLLVGAIVASTDAAAVLFLVRAQGLRLGRRVGAVIEIESATMIRRRSSSRHAGGASGIRRRQSRLGADRRSRPADGARRGAGRGGFGLAFVLNRLDLPGGLHPALVVAAAVLIYAATAMLHGSASRRLSGGSRAGQPARAGHRLHHQLPRHGDLALPDRDVRDAGAAALTSRMVQYLPRAADCGLPRVGGPAGGGLPLSVALPLQLAGEGLHLLGRSARGGVHLPRHHSHAGAASQCGGRISTWPSWWSWSR